jgi:hypothetical protein
MSLVTARYVAIRTFVILRKQTGFVIESLSLTAVYFQAMMRQYILFVVLQGHMDVKQHDGDNITTWNMQ